MVWVVGSIRVGFLIPVHLALLACSAGQSGGEIKTNEPAPNVGDCDEGSVPLTDEERSPLGFSAAETIAFAMGEHVGDATWEESAALELPEQPMTSSITLSLRRAAGEAWYVPGSGARSPDASPEPCVEELMVPVSVDLRTDDGALAEHWEVPLRSQSVGRAELMLNVSPMGLEGSLQPESKNPDMHVSSLVLSATFHADGAFSGFIAAQLVESERIASSTHEERLVSFTSESRSP